MGDKAGGRSFNLSSLAAVLIAVPASLWFHKSLPGLSQGGASDDILTVYSMDKLQHYSGLKDSEILLMSIWGRVFDVTSAANEFYGAGQGYKMFAGHDCTRAFALTSTKSKHLDQGLDDLTEKQLKHLNETYWGTYVAKYPIVGKMEDPPYDPSLYDHFAGPFSEVRRTQITRGNATAGAKKRESKCPVTRAAKAVGNAIVSMLPRGLLPR
eukprot:TRINITY_DN62941_c0_g1_i1.p1 TRINITY_DN62941_c0_g1~~TRINITY_DN62941_c0_g1_i1.p1  ORF type:complete len:220 (+),score=16.32 TRINITY_DN62941_c0_g1_i1:30-662(+)